MTSKRTPDFDLRRAIQDPGFTPRAADARELLALLASKSDDAAAAERALARIGPAVVAPALATAKDPWPSGRAAALRLLGRLPADPAIGPALVAGLADADERVRRAAAGALGRSRPADAEPALLSALHRETSASAKRAMAAALGKVGSPEALGALAGADAETARERSRAALMVARTAARAAPSSIAADLPAERPVRVSLRCRAGLEPLLAGALPASVEHPSVGVARVEGVLRGAPMELFQARTFLVMGFPLSPVKVAGDDPSDAIVESLASEEALSILRRWTVGPLRFRLSFRAGGKRRGAVWQVAAATARRAPELINDPTDSPWEVEVTEGHGEVRLELLPSLADPRFTYRKGDVPAASHPTIAAALVRVGGVHAADAVWDPFVGSGAELCERAIAGRYRSLVGSDIDARALSVARGNLDAAGAEDAALVMGDATSLPPPGPPPTLIVTNPPLGRRVQRGAGLGPLLDRFVSHAAGVLAKHGRLVWMSPFPARTREIAAARGLALAEAREVDLGGFAAEMQRFVKR